MLKEIILLVLVLSCSCARSHKCNGDEVNAIRLYNGTSASHSGILQICMYGSWIEICDHSWTQCQSLVVCENVTNVTDLKPLTKFNSGKTSDSKEFKVASAVDSTTCKSPSESFFNIMNIFALEQWFLGDKSYCDPQRDTIHIQCYPNIARDSCTEHELRLYNTTTFESDTSAGMLQICEGGTWKAVCDYCWSCSQAKVACKELITGSFIAKFEINAGGWTELGSAYMYCHSNKDKLSDCYKVNVPDEKRYSYCDPTRDTIYLQCLTIPETSYDCPNSHYEVQLVDGGTSSEGRLQICYGSIWHDFCDIDASFAATVCQKLGYTKYFSVITDGQFGQANSSHYVSKTLCKDNEAYPSINGSCHFTTASYEKEQCAYGNYNDCFEKPLGLRCYNSTQNCKEGDLQLVNGTVDSEGRLEVCSNGVWGTVCSHRIYSYRSYHYYTFKQTSAHVACNVLGYATGEVITNGKFGTGDGPIVYYDVDCYGGEMSISDCIRAKDYSFKYCHHGNIIGLKCFDDCTEGEVRLTEGSKGTVEICHERLWSHISDEGWDNNDATVTCKQLGYTGGIAYKNSKIDKLRYIVYHNFQCSGNETKLNKCSFVPLSAGTVTGSVAGVQCCNTNRAPPISGTSQILTTVKCNTFKFAIRGCSQICKDRSEKCVSSELTQSGRHCKCTSCTEGYIEPSSDVTIKVGDAKDYRCDAYCKKGKKCAEGNCDIMQGYCVCRFCRQ